MANRKILATAAMAAALTTGGVVGALVGTPVMSGAQEDPTTTAPATDPGVDADEGRGHGPLAGVRGLKLEAAAEAIGISVDDLKAALKEGKTLAQVAEANGVDRQTLIDALVAAGNEQLDELRASLPERMAELVDRTLPEPGEGPGGHGRGGPGRFDDGVAAQVLGLTTDELREQLKDGKTLAEVATAQGVERQTLVDALVASATERLAQAVTDGTITQERADEMTARLPEMIDKVVDGQLRHRGGRGGR
jgi:uncharacterized protein YidB (DUF937 family)